jgi:hypothetical protein
MSNWFGDLVSSVTKTMASVGTDLQEFVETISHDTEEAVESIWERQQHEASTGALATAIVKSTVTCVVDVIKTTLNDESSSAAERMRRAGRTDAPVVYDRYEEQLQTIRHSRDSYACPAEEEPGFAEWKAAFTLSDHTDQISRILYGRTCATHSHRADS